MNKPTIGITFNEEEQRLILFAWSYAGNGWVEINTFTVESGIMESTPDDLFLACEHSDDVEDGECLKPSQHLRHKYICTDADNCWTANGNEAWVESNYSTRHQSLNTIFGDL